jgi:hypothetical protein
MYCAKSSSRAGYNQSNGLFIKKLSGWRCIYAIVPTITADLQARPFFMDMTAENGKYSCALCDIKGVVVPKGAGYCRQFLLEAGTPRRTSKSVRANSESGTPKHPVLHFN